MKKNGRLFMNLQVCMLENYDLNIMYASGHINTSQGTLCYL